MQTLKIAFAATLVLTAIPGSAQDKGARALVESGLAAYVNNGAPAAIEAWLKGSAMEGNPQAISQVNALRQIEDFYGKPESYQILSENALSPKVTIVVAELNYRKGPSFLRMQAYQTSAGQWISTEFKFATDAASLLPPSMVYGPLK